MSSGRDVMLEEQQEQVKRPVGRPTSYDPSFCDAVIELGKKGKSKAQIACHLNVARQTLENWASEYPEFLDAITRAQDFALCWWEDQAQSYMLEDKEGQRLNASIWSRSMAARFPKDYRQEVKQEITGADGAPLLTAIQVSFVEADDNQSE